MYNNLSTKLKSARTNSGLTRKQISTLIGVSESMIGHYETGERLPSLNILVKLASHYKVSIDYLLDHDTSSNNLVSLDGLSDKQKQIVRDTIESFRNTSHS